MALRNFNNSHSAQILHKAFFTYLKSESGNIAKAIYRVKGIGDQQRAYAIELVYGIDFITHVEKDSGEGGIHRISLKTQWALPQAMRWSDKNEIKSWAKSNKFAIKGAYILDPAGKVSGKELVLDLDSASDRKTSWSGGTRKWKLELKEPSGLAKKRFTVPMAVDYQINGMRIKYQRDFVFNGEKWEKWNGGDRIGRQLRRIKIKGSVYRDAINQEMLIKLPSGQVIETFLSEGGSVPLMLKDGRHLGDSSGMVWLQEGDEVEVDYTSYRIEGAYIVAVKEADTKLGHEVTGAKVKWLGDSVTVKGDVSALTDYDRQTVVDARVKNGNVMMEIDFGSSKKINGLTAKSRGSADIYAEVNGKWQLVRSTQMSGNISFKEVKAQKNACRILE